MFVMMMQQVILRKNLSNLIQKIEQRNKVRNKKNTMNAINVVFLRPQSIKKYRNEFFLNHKKNPAKND